MVRVRVHEVVVALIGSVFTAVVMLALIEDRTNAVVAIGLLIGGPTWCYAIALVSDDSDFADATESRSQWLRVLPWTYLLAPFVVPNIFILTAFVRDSRIDSGRSALTSDRLRPGDHTHDHHWP